LKTVRGTATSHHGVDAPIGVVPSPPLSVMFYHGVALREPAA
jgi:hypothetical protein